MSLDSQLQAVIAVAKAAGKCILGIYESEDFDVKLKSLDSPLTRADVASHELITQELRELSQLPILSEESKKTIPYEERALWDRYWLVDPLDGTKEFIKRNGEFTINIALIRTRTPVLGVIYAPALNLIYYALGGQGAFKQTSEEAPTRLRARKSAGGPLKIVASRSHRGPALDEFLDRIKDYECLPVGSSLKFCAVAEGAAHLYPRLGPSMEWDTAAGQCIAEEAGAIVTDLQSKPLTYNKPNLVNPDFVVTVPHVNWQNWSNVKPTEPSK
jgi:3'(2'), 5'-bisphosphate nucleotidase